MYLAELEVAIRVWGGSSGLCTLRVTGLFLAGRTQPRENFGLGLALPWLCCVTITRFLTLSGPQLPHLKNGSRRQTEDPAAKPYSPLRDFSNLHSFIHSFGYSATIYWRPSMCWALRWALSYRCEETRLGSNPHRVDI